MQGIIILIFLIGSISYLCGLFDFYKKPDLTSGYSSEEPLIEHLTKYKVKTKKYATTPAEYQSFNRFITGRKLGEEVQFQYEFPLVGKHHHILSYKLDPKGVSSIIDYYGVPSSLFQKIDENHVGLSDSFSEISDSELLVKGGWYYRSMSEWGVDYTKMVQLYAPFSSPVAQSIYEALISKKIDTYFNRVQAALNFIQYIPYGQPNFDTNEWYYHEIAIPPEAFILSYADCDSKSVFLAAILYDLIPRENVILVACRVKSNNEKLNGGHMMLAVSDLGVEGEFVSFNQKEYLLLETTAPWIIGKTDWEEIHIDKIHNLV